MKKMLFVHDHRFILDEGNGAVYSSTGTYRLSSWERYLAAFSEVEVFARRSDTLPSRQLNPVSRDGVRFTLISHFSNPLRQVLHRRNVTIALRAACDQADSVVARLPSELGLIAVRLAKQMRKPYAVEVVGCALDSYAHFGGVWGKVYAPLAWSRMRSAVAGATQALYVTEHWLQARYPCAGFSIAASDVELEPMNDDRQRKGRVDRQRAIIDGSPPTAGTIGSLKTRYKGVHTAIEALSIIKRTGTRIRYFVVGSGDPAPLANLASALGVADEVTFLGPLPSDQIVGWLDTIDIYLQPSLTEGLPRATIEAMSRGCVCVGSKVGGIPELLPPDRMHAPGDAIRLASILDRLIKDPRALAAGSREDARACKRFGAGCLKEKRSAFFRRLATLESVEAGS